MVKSPPIPFNLLTTRTLKLLNKVPSAPTVPYPVTARARLFRTNAIFPNCLSEMKCKYPVEIIGVDNESKDRTAEIYEACGVPYFTETQHSCGFARLCRIHRVRINVDMIFSTGMVQSAKTVCW